MAEHGRPGIAMDRGLRVLNLRHRTCFFFFGSTKWGTSAAGDLEAAERRGSTGARSAVSTASSHVMDLRRARSLGTGPIHLGGSSEEDLCAQKFLFSCARERDVARSL